MLRLNTLAATAFALASLALPTFALTQAETPDTITHSDTRNRLQDVNLAEVVRTVQAADGAAGLPTAYCGEDRTTDYPANPGKAYFKVVYAFAADRPNRFAGWRDALQANVSIVQRFLSAQGGGTKALRFDMGTSCGPQYVDIQIVPLPGPRAAYADNFGAISGAVNRALGASATPRNTIILADGLAGGAQEYGLGETIMGTSGEKPGATNLHNRGGLTSILFSRDGSAAPGASRWGWWPEGFLHEMTHNLGAVQWGAPHSTQPRGGSAPNYGHCWQGAGPGQLPGHALEHVRLRLPRGLRRDRPGVRRRRGVGAAGPGRDLPAHDRRHDPPRLQAHRRGRFVDEQSDEVRLPVAAPDRRRLAGRRGRDRLELPGHQR
jgi:hypothetical protein